MAGFQTHIAVSTVVGVGYGYLGYSEMGINPNSAAVAAGLCALAGMLPDLDSDSGIPARETISLAAATVPMLLFHRLGQNGLSNEQMFLIGVPIYLFIRFAIGTLLKRFTVHRGMFHSIPAVALAGMIGYLLIETSDATLHMFKSAAIALGYFTHLLLDEIWSVNLGSGIPKVKKSFGSALKLFSGSAPSNSACYGMLILVSLAVLRDASANHLATAPSAQDDSAIIPATLRVQEPVEPVPQQRKRMIRRAAENDGGSLRWRPLR